MDEQMKIVRIIKYAMAAALGAFIGLIAFWGYEYAQVPELLDYEPVTVGYPVKVEVIKEVGTSTENLPAFPPATTTQ